MRIKLTESTDARNSRMYKAWVNAPNDFERHVTLIRWQDNLDSEVANMRAWMEGQRGYLDRLKRSVPGYELKVRVKPTTLPMVFVNVYDGKIGDQVHESLEQAEKLADRKSARCWTGAVAYGHIPQIRVQAMRDMTHALKYAYSRGEDALALLNTAEARLKQEEENG